MSNRWIEQEVESKLLKEAVPINTGKLKRGNTETILNYIDRPF